MKFLLSMALMAMSSVAMAQEPLTYAGAYKASAENGLPLMVLVTAEWCPPCQVMKATTIPELKGKNAFADVNFATVDYDSNVALASQLIGDRGLPQLLLFRQVDGEWKRSYLTGIQSVASVESFMQSSGVQIRVADSTTAGIAEGGSFAK